MPQDSSVLRIANCSGFYGDRLSAAKEMVEGGPIDVLTGDYLAELTMMILWKSRQKDVTKGYAVTFLKQMEQVLGTCLERGIKVVTNAGGLNPEGLATELRALCDKLGLKANIAHIEGDDLLPRLKAIMSEGHELRHLDTGRALSELSAVPVSANAYLGSWGIVEALQRGADVVVCPRVTDASVVVGPAAWHFGWKRKDWDRLAGAVVTGHILECGAQATGGNYAFFREVNGLEHPGFPLAEIYEDGSSVITKHPETGGLVSTGTVKAQLLYEIDGPRYANPDVVARFDTIQLEQDGPDRVAVSGTRGEPAPGSIKVCINYLGGFRNSMTFVLTGLDIDAKAKLVEDTLRRALGDAAKFDSLEFDLARSDKPDAGSNQQASAYLKVTVKSADANKIGRQFSSAVVEMALASYPGFFCTTPPEDASPFGVYWPALVPADLVEQRVVLENGESIVIEPTHSEDIFKDESTKIELPAVPGGPTKRVPLGTIFGARSGDKGGNANVGVWARSSSGYAWLADYLTVARFRHLVPDSEGLEVRRFPFPNIRALNFVIVGLLGEGVAASTRFDPQAKSLGEYLRSRLVDLPESLLDDAPYAPE